MKEALEVIVYMTLIIGGLTLCLFLAATNPFLK